MTNFQYLEPYALVMTIFSKQSPAFYNQTKMLANAVGIVQPP